MLPEISIKESTVVHRGIKEPIKKYSKQTQLPSHAAGRSNLRNNSHKREYKFYCIKSTEETKTGFPILPAALKACINNDSNVIDSTKSSLIPLRKLTENTDSISSSAVKRRRSSGVCKHKPGLKHYCGHKLCDNILSKYNTEVLDRPLFDLGSLSKTNFLSTNKELLTAKQNVTQNKAEEPPVLTRHKEHSPQQINSNNKGTFSISKSSKCDKTSQDAASTSSDAKSNNLCLQNGTQMDEQSLFLANFSLKRKVSQKEVNWNDLKFVNAETSNKAEAENTANIDEISVGIDPEAHSIDIVEESTNKMGPDISSESTNLEEVRDKGFHEFIEDHVCANPETLGHSQEGKDEVNTSSEKNTKYSDVNNSV